MTKIDARSCDNALSKIIESQHWKMTDSEELWSAPDKEIEMIGYDSRLYKLNHSSMVGDVTFVKYIYVSQCPDGSGSYHYVIVPEFLVSMIGDHYNA